MKVLAILYVGGKAAEEESRLLGTVENSLGIKDWLESQGHTLVVTDDKEGASSIFQKELKDTDILISTPFHPAYLTADLLSKEKSPNLKLCVTAGVGSDHVDLNECNKRKITVAEVSGSNVVSVAEHVIMTILLLVRNFIPAHDQIVKGDWNVAEVARNAFDLEGKVCGVIGAGRIGYRVLQRLVPFNCKELLYYDYTPIPDQYANEFKNRRVEDFNEFLSQCDVISVNCPLHEKTRDLINKESLKHFKKGAWLINTARGAICNAADVRDALESGQLSGYGGDVWNVQPAPKDHPWRTMTNSLGGGNGMVAHMSGTTLDAQKRYADGTKLIIEQFLAGKAIDKQNLIVADGQYATLAYGQRKKEN